MAFNAIENKHPQIFFHQEDEKLFFLSNIQLYCFVHNNITCDEIYWVNKLEYYW